MTYEIKEKIDQEFERFVKDEIDDSEKKNIWDLMDIKIIEHFSEILIEKSLKN